jgi:hypothetical protein
LENQSKVLALEQQDAKLSDYIEGIFSGFTKSIMGYVNLVLHPVDNLLYPVSQLFCDAL